MIIDTSPVNDVADALRLGHHADLFVYVIRANYLDKQLLETPTIMNENKLLPNKAILLNDTNYKKGGNEHGYGGTAAN